MPPLCLSFTSLDFPPSYLTLRDDYPPPPPHLPLDTHSHTHTRCSSLLDPRLELCPPGCDIARRPLWLASVGAWMVAKGAEDSVRSRPRCFIKPWCLFIYFFYSTQLRCKTNEFLQPGLKKVSSISQCDKMQEEVTAIQAHKPLCLARYLIGCQYPCH